MAIGENLMKNMGDWLGSAFKPKPDSVIAIDVGSSAVKLIQIKKEKGRILLETYGELATGPYANLSIGQATVLPVDKLSLLVKDLVKESNADAKFGGMAIPLKTSLIFNMKIPAAVSGMAKLDTVVPLEARKYIPVPIEEVALDWWVIPQSASLDDDGKKESLIQTGQTEILAAAVHREVMEEAKNLSESTGLELDFFEIETFGAIRSSLHNDLSAKVILDLGASSTKMTIIDYGVIRLSHTIGKGAQDITTAISRSLSVPFAKAEEIKRKVGLLYREGEDDVRTTISPIVEYIFSEANRIVLQYQQEKRRAVEEIILVGGGANLEGLLDVARKMIDVPVSVGKPFDKVGAPAFLDETLAQAGPSFAVVIGTALRALSQN